MTVTDTNTGAVLVPTAAYTLGSNVTISDAVGAGHNVTITVEATTAATKSILTGSITGSATTAASYAIDVNNGLTGTSRSRLLALRFPT